LGGDCDFVRTTETCEGMIGRGESFEGRNPTLSAIESPAPEKCREAISKNGSPRPTPNRSIPIRN
jgi:hypothetical protein